jgi:predicted MPP superfamily phosphohydrolase
MWSGKDVQSIRGKLTRTCFVACCFGFLLFSTAPPDNPAPPTIVLSNKADSVRFAAFGDMGTGQQAQYQTAKEMMLAHDQFKFDFVLMLGDNIYGGKSQKDFKRKFEDVYQPLMDAGVKFYASLGNHDDPNERYYKPFNMNGKRYYKLSVSGTELYALDSTYMDRQQLDWLEKELSTSSAAWKICFFHHPLYSDAGFHGPDTDLRTQLEPLFQKYGVAVVLSGHEHVYERIKPHKGVFYFISGSGGELRRHDLRPSPDTAKGFDEDQSFMLIEIDGNDFHFQTISRLGKTVDSGVIHRPGT